MSSKKCIVCGKQRLRNPNGLCHGCFMNPRLTREERRTIRNAAARLKETEYSAMCAHLRRVFPEAFANYGKGRM